MLLKKIVLAVSSALLLSSSAYAVNCPTKLGQLSFYIVNKSKLAINVEPDIPNVWGNYGPTNPIDTNQTSCIQYISNSTPSLSSGQINLEIMDGFNPSGKICTAFISWVSSPVVQINSVNMWSCPYFSGSYDNKGHFTIS
ncbi:hypothetical protein BN59_01234 [Legionella massiliensis]|uniref:Uncharacterized protein n=1 Tax=Legionella massiliensis TaxID=1034943 RepID=A0A078KRC8_9GAMM|nr:hypothetical protein [Legionella massiliensis]CDZ76955.1 hypothetical protein BN59_01234 [Legionella massiliensis]CEE12693.1 hypothetical protein BN1094_01234 [Legionella massiliensis]